MKNNYKSGIVKRLTMLLLSTILCLSQFSAVVLAEAVVGKDGDIKYQMNQYASDENFNSDEELETGDVKAQARASKSYINVAPGATFTMKLKDNGFKVFNGKDWENVSDASVYKPEYRWSYGSLDNTIKDADKSELTVSNAAENNTGIYYCSMYGTVGGETIRFEVVRFEVALTGISGIPEEGELEFGVAHDFAPVYAGGKNVTFEIRNVEGCKFSSDYSKITRTNPYISSFNIIVYDGGVKVASEKCVLEYSDADEYGISEKITSAYTDSDFTDTIAISHKLSSSQKATYTVSVTDMNGAKLEDGICNITNGNTLTISKESLEALLEKGINDLSVKYRLSINGIDCVSGTRYISINETDCDYLITDELAKSLSGEPSIWIKKAERRTVFNNENPDGQTYDTVIESITSSDSKTIKVVSNGDYFAIYGLKENGYEDPCVLKFTVDYGNNKTVIVSKACYVDSDRIEVADGEYVSAILNTPFTVSADISYLSTNGMTAYKSGDINGKKISISWKPYFLVYEDDEDSEEFDDEDSDIEYVCATKNEDGEAISKYLKVTSTSGINCTATVLKDGYDCALKYTVSADGVEVGSGVIPVEVTDEYYVMSVSGTGISSVSSTTSQLKLSSNKTYPVTITAKRYYLDSKNALKNKAVTFGKGGYNIYFDEPAGIEVLPTDEAGKFEITADEEFEAEGFDETLDVYVTQKNKDYNPEDFAEDEDQDYDEDIWPADEAVIICYQIRIVSDTIRQSISGYTMNEIIPEKFAGKDVLAPVIITDEDGDHLVQGRDFVVKYSNNKRAGTAKVVATGIGDYRGTISKEYVILPCDHNNVTAYEAVKPECKKTGNTAYWVCADCKCYFSDAALTNEIAKDFWVVKGASAHKMTSVAAKAATCTAKGNKAYYKCNNCGYYYSNSTGTKLIADKASVVIPATGHSSSKVAAKAPKCTTTGNIEYWMCSACKKTFADKDAKTAITKDEYTIPATGHLHVTKTEAVAATCDKAGNKAYYTCLDCGKFYSDAKCTKEIKKDSWVISKLGHKLGKQVKKVESTCQKKGKVAYYKCSRCGCYFSDSKATKLIPEDKLSLPLKDHSYTKKVVNSDTLAASATCTAAAKYCYSCDMCGAKSPSKTFSSGKALGHSYKVVATNPASITEDGSIEKKCDRCQDETSVVIRKASKISQSAKTVKYKKSDKKTTAKIKLTVKDSNGDAISSSYYTLAYENDLKAGKGTVTITFKGNYTGCKTFQYTITGCPKK